MVSLSCGWERGLSCLFQLEGGEGEATPLESGVGLCVCLCVRATPPPACILLPSLRHHGRGPRLGWLSDRRPWAALQPLVLPQFQV